MRRVTKPGKCNLVWRLTRSKPVIVRVWANHLWLALCEDGKTYRINVRERIATIEDTYALTPLGSAIPLPSTPEHIAQTAHDQENLDRLAAGIWALSCTEWRVVGPST